MLTRCPECGTTFRVTPEQLKARNGRVRCGACRRIFDALETLAEETQIFAAGHAAEPAEEAEPPPAAANEAATMAEPAAAAEIARVEETATEIENADVETPPAAVTATAAAAPAAAPLQAPAAEPPAVAEPYLPAEKAGRRRTWPWLLGVCVALLGLVVQAALHFRTEIAVLYPETRPLLVAACDRLGCKLMRPRKPELVGIEASDLSVAGDGRLMLAATLRNRAPFAQEYPHLELTLTDTADRALVRRVLAPTEYLLPQTPPADGFGARAEVAVTLAVRAPDIAAAGYRLYLFYP